MRQCWFPAVEQELSDAVAAAEITEKLSQSACANADDDFTRFRTRFLAHSRRSSETVTTECVSMCSACAESTIGVSVEI